MRILRGMALSLVLTLSVAACAGAAPTEVRVTPAPGAVDFSGFRICPDKVYLVEGIQPGAVARQYAVAGESPDHPEYNWKVGDPLAVQIHSAFDEPTTFVLTVEATDRSTVDKSTGVTYDPMPAFALPWVEVQKEVTVQPNTIARVPVVFRVPEDIQNKQLGLFPNHSEFRIRVAVKMAEGTNTITTDMMQRWLLKVR